jgi:hypothetical protein
MSNMNVEHSKITEGADGRITITYYGFIFSNNPMFKSEKVVPLRVERWNTPDDVGPIWVQTKVELEKFMLGRIKTK